MSGRKVVRQISVPMHKIEFESGNKYLVLTGLEDFFMGSRRTKGKWKKSPYGVMLDNLLAQTKEPEKDIWFFIKLDKNNKVIHNEFFLEDEIHEFSINRIFSIFFVPGEDTESPLEQWIIHELNKEEPNLFLAGDYVEKDVHNPQLQLTIYENE